VETVSPHCFLSSQTQTKPLTVSLSGSLAPNPSLASRLGGLKLSTSSALSVGVTMSVETRSEVRLSKDDHQRAVAPVRTPYPIQGLVAAGPMPEYQV
jgi:hypothetical protein